MQRRELGPGKLAVSALGLGCMGMSGTYGSDATRDPAEALATLDLALELGINFLDTAEVYGPYRNEELVGRALAGRRARWVVASKFGFRIGADGSIAGCDGTPANARRACEASLRRLGIETIDLYYLHRLDPAVPVEETVGAMAELVRAGKVRHLGLSEVSAATLRRAAAVHPIAALQSEYSLFERAVEREVLPACRALGVGFVPFAPLGRGFLTGAARRAEDYRPAGDFRGELPRFQGGNFERNQALVRALERLAARRSATPAQLALAWLLAQGPSIVPIPGAARRAHLADNAAAAAVALPACDLMALEEAFPRDAAAGERYPEAELRYVDR
ncbi:MAG TPA: aldo/keto reductase [Steroidobacteraceae bacterium]|nr:aldo/keto reductase [Steroidobacteraceae bacterium]